MLDLRIAVDALVVLVVTESVLKPVAIYMGKGILRWLDRRYGIIPDWLHTTIRDE